MRTKANLNGHPVHPILVAFPITFYTTTLMAFIVYNWFSRDPFWFRLGYFCNLAGVSTALLAAIPGFVDWSVAIPRQTAAKARGLLHMSLNLMSLLLFASSAYLLRGSWNDVPVAVGAPLWLSMLGVLATSVAGYHGWEMIATHKLGVNLTPAQEALETDEDVRIGEPSGSLRPRGV